MVGSFAAMKDFFNTTKEMVGLILMRVFGGLV
jgi:hypothetical protein